MGEFGLDGQKENYGDRMAVIAELHWNMKTERQRVSVPIKTGNIVVPILKIPVFISEKT